MKIIYCYNYLDQFGKPQYQKIEISEEDEKNWSIADYERRVSEGTNEENKIIKPRTLQEFMDEINVESYNQDRRHRYHKDILPSYVDEDGNKINKIDTIPSSELTSEERMIEEEKQRGLQEKLKKALSLLSPIQRRRIIKRYISQMTLKEIAVEEGVHFSVVYESIQTGIKKIKKNQKHP